MYSFTDIFIHYQAFLLILWHPLPNIHPVTFHNTSQEQLLFRPQQIMPAQKRLESQKEATKAQ